jgi:putative thioredoxin
LKLAIKSQLELFDLKAKKIFFEIHQMSHIEEINTDNAQELVIDESFNRLVLVGFWADWCSPCKVLMPILEKLALEYSGQFLLAKVNADTEQMIAGQFGVRSLPTVMLIKDGQPVDSFSGAQNEQNVRDMLDKYLPRSWDLALIAAREHIENHAFAEAYEQLKPAYAGSHKQTDIALAMVECLIEMKRYEEADAALGAVSMASQNDQYTQLLARLELAQQAKKAPEIEELEAQFKRSPNDTEIAFQLALEYGQHQFSIEALHILLGLLKQNLNFRDGEAKRIYLDILAVLGKTNPLALEYQRKIYTLLY